MNARHLTLALAASLSLAATGAHAAPDFGGIDLAGFSFDIVNYQPGSSPNGAGGDATASGTSNGIGWSISPTSLWNGRTTTNGSFTFAALPAPTDSLHPSTAFTITFTQPIAKLLVALSNDNTNDSVNFGVAPTLVQGLTVNGTQIVLNNAAGGLALFENLHTLTLTHTDNNGITDGFDLAFHAIAAVPEPGSWALMLGGLAAVGGWASRRRQPTTRGA